MPEFPEYRVHSSARLIYLLIERLKTGQLEDHQRWVEDMSSWDAFEVGYEQAIADAQSMFGADPFEHFVAVAEPDPEDPTKTIYYREDITL